MTRMCSTSPAVRPDTMTSRLPAGLPTYRRTSVAVVVAAVLTATAASAAHAQADNSTAQQVQALKEQVEQLQHRLEQLEAQQSRATAAVTRAPESSPQTSASEAPVLTRATSTSALAEPTTANTHVAAEAAQGTAAEGSSSAPPPASGPGIQAGPVLLTVGGFVELASIYRNKNESADVGSSFNSAIPYTDNQQSSISEFRESARQSRISLLAQGDPWAGARAEAYFETDFLGAAPTANSNESNSYNLRMRNIYARYISDSGFYFLAGQSWSLATLYTQGLEVRKEDVPLTIDAQYVAGFNWTRNPQVRVVDQVGPVSFGLSLESPQAQINTQTNVPSSLSIGGVSTPVTSPYPAETVYNNAGGSLFAPTNNYAIDPAPDVIAKVAVDPGFGHYELYGMGRWFRSNVAYNNETTFGGSVGAGMILPIVPDMLKFQLSGLYGHGIGRYGSAQLPDVTIRPDGTLAAIPEYDVLAGLQFLPIPTLTIYGYAGREQASSTAYVAPFVFKGITFGPYAYGYGSDLYNNSDCYLQGTSGSCTANTQSVNEVTGGIWWKYYQGALGNLQFGLQGAYLQRDAFYGKGGSPEANIFIGMASFRYYPYQK